MGYFIGYLYVSQYLYLYLIFLSLSSISHLHALLKRRVEVLLDYLLSYSCNTLPADFVIHAYLI